MSRYSAPVIRRTPTDPIPRVTVSPSEGPRSRTMSTPVSNSKLPEPKKRFTQKDETTQRKLGSERKRNLTEPLPTQPIVKRKAAAPKGSLAALRPSPALTVLESTTVAEASRLCATKRTNCFLVVDDQEELSGIVTSQDLVYRVIADGLDPRSTLVGQVMTRDPMVALESSSASDALEIMVSNSFRHIPVCGDDESVTGVVDLVKVVHETLGNAQRRSAASEQLINAMAGVTAELGAHGTNTDMLTWATKLRERTALPDLASVVGSCAQPATVNPKASVRVVAQIMRDNNVSAVCIMEDTQLQSHGTVRRSPRIAGILTSEEIVARVLAAGTDPSHCSVVRVMVPRPETLRLAVSIHHVVKKMHDSQWSNITVVDDDDRLIAILNILSLAEACHEQIKASYLDVAPPDPTAESRPVLGDFLESIRSDTPRAAASETVTTSTIDDPLRSPRSEMSTSDSIGMIDELFPMSMSISSLTDSSTPATTAPPSVADAQSPRDLLKDLPSPSAFTTPLSSPPIEMATYLFKFRTPSGITHRVDARADDHKHLRDLIVAKLMTDHSFDSSSDANSGPRPDPNDFHLLFADDDGDDVAITDDNDVRQAINISKKEGKDRVMLTIRGGRSWAAIQGGDASTKPIASTSTIVSENVIDPVAIPAQTTPREDITPVQEAPPQYTPKSISNESPTHPNFAPKPDSTQVIALAVQAFPEPVLPDEVFTKTFSFPSTHGHTNETKINSTSLPVTFSEEKRRPNTTSLGSLDQATLNKIRDLVARLADIFDDLSLYKKLLERRDAQAQKLLDTFQTLLDTPGLSPKLKRNLLVATQRLSRQARLYPKCYNLEDIEMVEDHPIAAGSFADIYKARFLGQAVCLKVIRVYQNSHVQSFLKQFSAEAVLWGQLSHLNLLPVYGLYHFSGRLCLVSPWMENGDITRFLKENPSVTRALLVLDIATGIGYLHEQDIVHGDLKGANILVDGCGRARLADFGLSAVSDSEILHWTAYSSAASRGGSVRWQAPELFNPDHDHIIHNTTASDVYAFACVAYEIFTGNIPFYEAGRDSAAMVKVQSGERPSRPPPSSLAWSNWGLTEATWSLLQSCWQTDPLLRPHIQDVISYFQSIIHVDARPLESDDLVLTPAHFRDSVGGRADLPSVDDLDAIVHGSESNNEGNVPTA